MAQASPTPHAMKRLLPPGRLPLALAVTLLLGACGGGGTKLDLGALSGQFAAAAPALKAQADGAAKALQAGDYTAGLKALAALAKEPDKLTEEQRNAMIAAASQVQILVSERPSKEDDSVHQLVEDMMAALEGRPARKVGAIPLPEDTAPQ